MAEKATHEEINQKEMLLKASSAQWQTTLDAINNAVCLLDMNGTILRCNKAMESLLKKSSFLVEGFLNDLKKQRNTRVGGNPALPLTRN